MRRLIFIVTLVGIVGFACSSSKSTKTSSDTTAAGGTTGSTKAPHFSGSSTSDYCDLARSFAKVPASISSDPKAAFAQFDSLVGRLLKTVPSTIKGDANTLVAGIRTLEDAVKAANYDVKNVNPAALSTLQDPKFMTASDRIDEYDQQVCKIDNTTTTT